MKIDRIFLAYMALIGIGVGALLVAAPSVQDFVIKPYFWILIAVGLFDAGAFLRGKNAPGTMLTMQARVLGFIIGSLLMAAVPTLAGVQVRFL